MKLTVLGCGDAFGNGGRNNSAFLLSQSGEHILVDCGASTLIRLKHESVVLEEISTILISHFHGDHYGGIPFFLISSLFENPRQRPLTIIGPPSIEAKVSELLEALYTGTLEKLGQLEITFIEYGKEPIKLGDKKIVALPVEHSPPSLPHGIRLEWKDKVFAFSGDTSWSNNLVPLCDQADLFVCECNFLHEQAFGHLCYDELVERRDQLACENIWLSHMGNEVLSQDSLVFNKLSDGMKIEF